MHARARDRAEARLEADDAAIGGGTDHRAERLRADRDRHEPRRDGRRRTARRSAGRVRGVPRIARLAGLAIGELGSHGLSHDEAAQRLEAPHDPRRMRGDVVREDARAHPRRDAARRDDVLHAHRDAEERKVLENPPRPLLGFGHGARRIEPFPGLDARVERRHALRAGGHIVLDGGTPFTVGPQGFDEPERIKVHCFN